jgi:hypothetical protein
MDAGCILGPAHAWNGPPDGGAAMLALLTDWVVKLFVRHSLLLVGGHVLLHRA